ncbi:multicopper oxidase domain-containing protein [Pseudonocardia sp.]|uniref:multicopper oxidase domain-containing protein n=1 Tax=Pseudonocardia sp. TaxID=60912 RepID=UPI002639112D|nr:multicopper oxidase domain-containing protein [Pseudonocardia sp.]MCW2720156.1 multicopper oxidase type 3 [Pseudonocardia sp.]
MFVVRKGDVVRMHIVNTSGDIAFVADNPGIRMDHCHDLPHASQGLVAHLMYEGVTEPYAVGARRRTSRSDPCPRR